MNSERGNSPRHATLQSTNNKYTARGGTAARLQLKADVLALLLIATGEAAIAQAQQSPAPPGQLATNMDQGAGSGGLQEVVVTANKRRENIQDVPIAIAAISESDLAAHGVQNTLDVGAAIPGLTMQGSMNGLQAHLRGVGTTAIAAGEENSIATYIDGVYIASLSGSFLQLSNIEQIEVDKGPQGTLFGRNATGGVISITTKAPSHAFGGSAAVSYGNYQTAVASAYVTGGLTDNLAADLAVYFSNQGQGYGRNFYTGNEVQKNQDLAARSKWLYTPSDIDTLTFAFDFERSHSSTYDAFRPVYGHPTDWGPGEPQPTGQPYLFTGGPWDLNDYLDPFDDFKQGGASLNYQHDFGVARLTDIVAYREAAKDLYWSSIPVPTRANTAGWHETERQVSEELQIASPDQSLIKWVGGFFYLHGRAAYEPFKIQGSATTPPPLNYINFLSDELTDSYAAFGQSTAPIPFISNTNITVGLRYTRETRGITGATILHFLPPAPALETAITDTEKTFNSLTWRLSFDHHFTENLLGYASYNRGFKSGMYNTIPAGGPNAQPVNPELLDAYELGFKSDAFEHRLRLNASAFFYKYSDLQVTVFTPTSALLENGANAHIYGIDGDMQIQLTSQLSLQAGMEWLHDRFVYFPDSQDLIPQTVAQGGGNLPTISSAAGHRLPYTPDWSANLSLDYKLPSPVGPFDLNVAYSYRNGWYATPDNHLKSPISNLLNAQAAYTPAQLDRLRLVLWGRNLTNQAVPMFLGEANNPGGYDEEIDLPPRTYGLRLEYTL
jgi:iron complex outermembrane recepter protein